jgi:hypothetical protein
MTNTFSSKSTSDKENPSSAFAIFQEWRALLDIMEKRYSKENLTGFLDFKLFKENLGEIKSLEKEIKSEFKQRVHTIPESERELFKMVAEELLTRADKLSDTMSQVSCSIEEHTRKMPDQPLSSNSIKQRERGKAILVPSSPTPKTPGSSE